MRVFAVDDEQPLLEELHDAIAASDPEAEILDFLKTEDVLAAIGQGLIPELVFADIRMSGTDWPLFVSDIKAGAPQAGIVFVAGYARDTEKTGHKRIYGYLLRSVDAAAVLGEMDHMPQLLRADPDKLQIRCFGNFEVFWRGTPLTFARRKTKELLAYLVDKKGAFCNGGELCSVLWEDSLNPQKAMNYLRVLTNDLVKTLRRIGLEDALLRERNGWAVNLGRIDCDYYQMMNGDAAAANAFHGQYMEQYSWAEITAANLYFRKII